MIKTRFTIEKMILGTCIANPHAWKYLAPIPEIKF